MIDSFLNCCVMCITFHVILFYLQPDDRRACDQDIATENVEISRQMDESSHSLTVITL